MEEDEDPIDNNNSELQEEVEEHDYSAASDEKQNIAEEAEMGTNGAGNPIQSMLTRRRRSTAAGYRTTTHSAWEYVGQFATEDEVTELRHRLKVAVNSCVQQKKGLKTYFYCTKRGSFGCGFQMYSMQAEKNGPIALYKSGQHNHAINKSEGDQLSHSHQKPLFAHTADDLQSIILGTSRMNDSAVGMAVFALSQQATKFSDFGVSPGALQETPVEPSISKHVLSDSLKRTLFGTSGEALEMNGEELDPQAAAHEESHQPAVSSSSQFGITAEIFEDDGALATKRPLGPKRMRKQAVPMRSTFESPAPYSLAD
uniref:Uncharacterized protein n=1 Tax=Plectus sambesii TaxID=2011161 RepID=A0A914W5M9_9BILA